MKEFEDLKRLKEAIELYEKEVDEGWDRFRKAVGEGMRWGAFTLQALQLQDYEKLRMAYREYVRALEARLAQGLEP